MLLVKTENGYYATSEDNIVTVAEFLRVATPVQWKYDGAKSTYEIRPHGERSIELRADEEFAHPVPHCEIHGDGHQKGSPACERIIEADKA